MAKALSETLADDVRAALTAVLGDAARGADPLIRPPDHPASQARGVLPLARPLRGTPGGLAPRVAAALVPPAGGAAAAPPPAATSGVIAAVEVAGPGFLNLTLTDTAL